MLYSDDPDLRSTFSLVLCQAKVALGGIAVSTISELIGNNQEFAMDRTGFAFFARPFTAGLEGREVIAVDGDVNAVAIEA